MSEKFNACVKAGGRVRTKMMSGGRYMHICYKDGKSYAGDIKSAKKKKKS